MSFGEKYLPLAGVNVDLAPSKIPKDKATFLKNLVYSLSDTADGGKSNGADTGVFKTFQSNAPYISGFELPAGDNYCIGALSSRETKQVFVWIYNSQLNHTVYVLNGETQTMNVMLQGSFLNLQLNPENFIHIGASCIFVLYITDPDTGLKKRKTFITWVDNFNPNRFTCVEDAIATNGFDANVASYFDGDYNHDNFINAGVPPDQDCIAIEEEAITDTSAQKNNNLLFNTWQWRTRWVDVWGRPSDWSIISDLYIPGLNDCLSSSANIARCVKLTMSTPPPNVNQLEIAYRNCNDLNWYKAETLDLFNGSNLGNWWTRTRNPDIEYNSDGTKIIYTFCNDKQCDPISPAETTRLFNPIPNKSLGAAPIGNTIAYSNNEYGFNPLPKTTQDKIEIKVSVPDSDGKEIIPRNITIYVPIYNIYRNNFQQVFKDGELGYSWGDNNANHGGARAYHQYFANTEQSGFNGYLVGANSVISSQVYVVGTNELAPDINHEGANISQLKYNNTGYTMQKFVFTNIPPGVYVFRLSSHLSNPNTDVGYRNTSTTLWGKFGLKKGELIPEITTKNYNPTQELVIDVCDKDYDTLSSGEMLVVADLAAFSKSLTGNYRTLAVYGYISETGNPDSANIPMELMEVAFAPQSYRRNTDHNGFYWECLFLPPHITGIPVRFTFINKCVPTTTTKGFTNINRILKADFSINEIGGSAYSDFSVTPCNRIEITGRLMVSGTNIGIPGVDVVLTRGQVGTTDSNGYFKIIAHDDVLANPRKDQLIITNGTCRYYVEGSVCIPPIPIQIYRCTVCAGVRTLDVGTRQLLSNFLLRGLLSGGTYALGVAGKDFLDRSQFVQDLGYITIPTVQETKVFEPSKVTISIPPDTVFPDGIEKLVFSISAETTISNYVTWIVDYVEFVDNTGNVNNSNPTQIKIYYASLIEYNKQNAYNTTVDWGFIQEGTLEQPVTTDNVTFLVNGDGKFFEKSITARVKYAQDGEYFLINYTEDLKDLKPNAFIRLFRPNECTTIELMYEICNPITVVNNKALVNSFTLNAFDTYYINREIPVPAPNQPDDADPVLETRVFAYPFEHDSPSDFWGKGCKNIGRVNVKNPYEAVIYKPNELALSGSFSENGYVNYLSYFEDGYITADVNVPSRKVSFDNSNLNGIVSVIPKIGIVLLIGQGDSATVGVNDNLLRQNADGTISVPSGENTFGKPNVNSRENFGCLVWDKNSISEDEGFAHWVDSYNACITQHDFNEASDMSSLSCGAYMRAKIKEVYEYNLNHSSKRYFSGCCNPINKEYLVTDKIIGDASYFNDLRDKDVTYQETFAFDINSKFLKDWRSYTPEYYSFLKGEKNDQQLFTFKNGVPYYHYTAISDNTQWGSFYGTPAERIIEIVVNLDELKKKKGLFAGVYSHHLYFVDRILTEANQESWIPIDYFKQGDFFWSAPLLCDLNTPPDPNRVQATGANKLLDGNVLYGIWMKIRFVGVPEDNTTYTELTGFTVDVIPQEKSGA